MRPDPSTIAYQLDLATKLKGLIEQAFSEAAATTWDLNYAMRGDFHEFMGRLGPSAPEFKIVVKVFPPEHST